MEQDADKLKVRVAAGRLKKPEKINRALGRLSGRYPRVARYYTLQLHTDEKGQAEVTWARKDAAQQLAEELDGTYLLRTDAPTWRQPRCGSCTCCWHGSNAHFAT